MRARVIYKVALLLIILFALSLIWYFRPRYVKLELATNVQNTNIKINEDKDDFNSEYHWWFIDSEKEIDLKMLEMNISPRINKEMFFDYPENIINWGIDLNALGVDFNKNNVILAFSREIKEMKFKRADSFPFQSIPTVKTIMSKTFEPNTIYVYKIPKYDVCEDLRAYTETSVEK